MHPLAITCIVLVVLAIMSSGVYVAYMSWVQNQFRRALSGEAVRSSGATAVFEPPPGYDATGPVAPYKLAAPVF